MGWATKIFLGLIPLAFANQVYYYPLPTFYNVPHVPLVPLVHQPYNLPQLRVPSPHGNRKHEVSAGRKYHHGDCEDLTADWQEWETGATVNFRSKRPALRSSEDWNVELIFDNTVESLEVYNGIADSKSGSSFRVTPSAWKSRAASTDDDINFSIKANFNKNLPRPSLEAVVLDGVHHECNPGSSASPVVSTKGVRLASHAAWPRKVLGLYILLADDDEDGFDSTADWEPQLFDWQQEASNVLFFTFIHPDTMEIPPSFQKLAASRGTDQPGAVPKDTVIMFAIGGYAYSIKPNPWHWLTSKEAAEKMAEKVSTWHDKYGCDGIDLDLEEGAGSKKAAGPNMIHFIRRLKELSPNMIVSQPVYGYPQVQAESDVINASWDTEGNSQGLADSLGLMVYEGTQALNYVKNYAKGSEQWEGFPIKVNAPKSTILLGAKGSSGSATTMKLANAAVKDDILGIMVWYASVKNGFDYAANWDASTKNDSIEGYKQAMKLFNKVMASSSAGEAVREADATVVDTDSSMEEEKEKEEEEPAAEPVAEPEIISE